MDIQLPILDDLSAKCNGETNKKPRKAGLAGRKSADMR
jgi:hypothetical protein